MRTSLAFTLLTLAVVASGEVPEERSGNVGYGGGYGDGYGGGGGGGYGGHGRNKWGDVEMFLKVRQMLIETATNAVGFSPMASLNDFNTELITFRFALPGKLSMYVRELEKVPPYYKYDYLHKKATRGVDTAEEEDMN